MWKFSLLENEWSELRLIKKPAPRFGFVAGTFEDYWYISHGEPVQQINELYRMMIIMYYENQYHNVLDHSSCCIAI